MTDPAGDDLTVASALRSLGLPVYLPAWLFAIGQGAVVPIVALAARDLGASLPTAGLIVALQGVASLLFDLPAGSLVGRMGERRAMTASTVVLGVALTGAALTSSLLVFAVCVFAIGCGQSVWVLARLSYVTNVMPNRLRGRALSTLGGIQRIGAFIGPLLAAAAMAWFDVDGAFYVYIAAAVAALVALLAVPEPPSGVPDDAAERDPRIFRTLVRTHRSTWATGGVAIVVISLLRSARPVVVPLWAAQIGLSPAQVSLIFALSSACDMLLFYPAGSVMDRWGRKFAVVPSAAMLSVGFLLIPLTRSFLSLAAVGLLIGLANGISSGVIMTLGSDFAPVQGRPEFLGIWRLIADTGQTGGPLLVGLVSGVASLGAASVAVAVVGVAGAVFIARVVPETHRGTHSTADAAPS